MEKSRTRADDLACTRWIDFSWIFFTFILRFWWMDLLQNEASWTKVFQLNFYTIEQLFDWLLFVVISQDEIFYHLIVVFFFYYYFLKFKVTAFEGYVKDRISERTRSTGCLNCWRGYKMRRRSHKISSFDCNLTLLSPSPFPTSLWILPPWQLLFRIKWNNSQRCSNPWSIDEIRTGTSDRIECKEKMFLFLFHHRILIVEIKFGNYLQSGRSQHSD